MNAQLSTRSTRWLLLLLAAAMFLSTAAFAGKLADPVNQTSKGIAVKGYDMVAYFIDGQPAKGDQAITYEWNGATWRFASAEHRDLFASEPEKYAPQYGGYCAYGVSQGATVSFDPNAWTIVDGKLYLNLSKRIQKKWGKDIPGYIDLANQKWPNLIVSQ